MFLVLPNVFGPPTMVAAGVDFKDRLVTLFDSDCDDGVSAGIWVIHTGPKSGGHAFWRLL